jgi:hypothetical protein
MACNRLRLGLMLSLPSVVLSRDDTDLVHTKVGRVIPGVSTRHSGTCW